MQSLRDRLRNPWIIAGAAFLAGLILGWLVLGWWIWPVDFIDATPAELRADLRIDYLRAAVDSFAVTGDANAARQQGFLDFPLQCPLLAQEKIFGELLRYGRSALHDFPVQEVGRHGAGDPPPHSGRFRGLHQGRQGAAILVHGHALGGIGALVEIVRNAVAV